jgi:hypothetical protein
MIRGEMLNILAILAPLSVNASALQTSRAKPIKRDTIDISILM